MREQCIIYIHEIVDEHVCEPINSQKCGYCKPFLEWCRTTENCEPPNGSSTEMSLTGSVFGRKKP